MSFVIKWKHGQGCTKWPLNLTKFSFFRKILSLFPLKTLCTGVNFADERYHLFKFFNTSNVFIKLKKQLVNQQRIGTYVVCFQWNKTSKPSFDFSFGTKDQRYKIEKYWIQIENLISYKLKYLNNAKKQGWFQSCNTLLRFPIFLVWPLWRLVLSDPLPIIHTRSRIGRGRLALELYKIWLPKVIV